MPDPSHTPCPAPDRLRALLADGLSPDDRTAAEAHVEACAWCRGTLDVLAAEDRQRLDRARSLPATPVTVDSGLLGDPPTEASTSAPGSGSGSRTASGSFGATEFLDPDDLAGDRPPGHGPDPEHPAGLAFLAPTDRADRIGQFGPYEVMEVLGRGGMGVVLKAFDPALHRVVAIKVLAPQLAAGATARKRFLREGRAAASITHEHVVTIHAVDEQAGFPYLVMQYIGGKSLQDRVDADGPLPVAEILRIGMQTATGLAAAHAQGLVHRDIKPGNILLENGIERVKITDFGLARAIDDPSLTQAGVVAGTPEYMAPEQARGEAVDARSDLFSLGAVLYTIATGRSPFRAPNTPAVLRRVCDELPRPIRESNPEIPGWLDAIINRLLAKHPADRYQSAEEVAHLLGDRLAAWQRGEAMGRPLVDHEFGFEAGPVPKDHGGVGVGPSPVDWVGPAKQPGSRPRARSVALYGLAALAGLGLLAYTALTPAVREWVPTTPAATGELVVEAADPEVRVEVDGVEQPRDATGQATFHVAPGAHEVRARRRGLIGPTQRVAVSPQGRTVVRIAPRPGPLPGPPLVVVGPANPGRRGGEVMIVAPDRERLDVVRQIQEQYRDRRLALEDAARQLGFQLGVARKESEARDRDLARLTAQAGAGSAAPGAVEQAKARVATAGARVHELEAQLNAVQGRIAMLGEAGKAVEAEQARLRARLSGSDEAPTASDLLRKLGNVRRSVGRHARDVAAAGVEQAAACVDRTAAELEECEVACTQLDARVEHDAAWEAEHDQAHEAFEQAKHAHAEATDRLAQAKSHLAAISAEVEGPEADAQTDGTPAEDEPFVRFERRFEERFRGLDSGLPANLGARFRDLGEVFEGLGERLRGQPPEAPGHHPEPPPPPAPPEPAAAAGLGTGGLPLRPAVTATGPTVWLVPVPVPVFVPVPADDPRLGGRPPQPVPSRSAARPGAATRGCDLS